MTRKDHLKYCSICVKRKFDLQQGILCGLTNKVANFESECYDYDYDEKVKEEVKDKAIRLAKSRIMETANRNIEESLIKDISYHALVSKDYNYVVNIDKLPIILHTPLSFFHIFIMLALFIISLAILFYAFTGQDGVMVGILIFGFFMLTLAISLLLNIQKTQNKNTLIINEKGLLIMEKEFISWEDIHYISIKYTVNKVKSCIVCS